MSTTEIPDVTVLTAIDRAERHRGRPGVPVWLIFEHRNCSGGVGVGGWAANWVM
jgi:hypothetical protein